MLCWRAVSARLIFFLDDLPYALPLYNIINLFPPTLATHVRLFYIGRRCVSPTYPTPPSVCGGFLPVCAHHVIGAPQHHRCWPCFTHVFIVCAVETDEAHLSTNACITILPVVERLYSLLLPAAPFLHTYLERPSSWPNNCEPTSRSSLICSAG